MSMPISAAHAAPRVHRSTDIAMTDTPLRIAGSIGLCAALCVALAGCAAGTKRQTLPPDGPTMVEIYRQHMNRLGQRPAPSEAGTTPHRGADGTDVDGDQLGAMNESHREVDSRFTRLPNPDLVMYVTPHLSANGRYPVPGYSTVFPMYETVEYAMPGEVPWRSVAPTAVSPVAVNGPVQAAGANAARPVATAEQPR